VKLIASDVAKIVGGRLVGGDAEATTLIADSRQIVDGVAFAAIGGGEAFVTEALSRGAPFVVATHAPSVGPTVLVDDVIGALMRLAKHVRDTLDLPVIGITGSTGKTLTRDLIAAALGTSLVVHRTPKNYNAEIGVPLTLFATPDDAEALVFELGARHAGEIGELCDIVRPEIGVITGIGAAHIDEFGSRDAIARAKAELLVALPADGLAILPSDDDYLALLASSTTARVVTVGPGGAVRYRGDRVTQDGRTYGTIAIGSETIEVVLPVPGRALMRNAALAVAVAAAYDIDPRAAAASLADAELTSWRMEIATVGEWTVINDAYNANPTSTAASLRAAREVAGSRPAWAVLGQMAELGDMTETEHRRAGALAAALGYAGVIVLGAEAEGIAVGAGDLAMRVGSLAEAVDAVRQQVPSGAVIVVKASRVAGLERLVPLLDPAAAQVG
jgi:UDP-N-acetylmuramoyl-tripeptide--D-alanyl-D-alanine ligase